MNLRGITGTGDSLFFAFANGMYLGDRNGKLKMKTVDGIRHLYMKGLDKNVTVYKPRDSTKRNFLKNLSIIHQYKPGKFFVASSISVSSLEFRDQNVFETVIISDKINSFFFDSGLNRYFFYNRENVSIVNPETKDFIRINANQLSVAGISGISYIAKDSHEDFLIHAGDKLYLYNYLKRKFVEMPVTVNLSEVKVALYRDLLVIAGGFGIAYTRILPDQKITDLVICTNPRKIFYNRVDDFLINDGLVQMSTG